MKAPLWLSFLCACALSARAESVSLGATHDPATGREIPFLVPESVVRAAPAWTPGEKDVPLEMSRAIELARRQARQDYGDKVGKLRRVLFMKFATTKDGEVWAYSVNFRLSDNSDLGASYVVLLDGTVVSPTRDAR